MSSRSMRFGGVRAPMTLCALAMLAVAQLVISQAGADEGPPPDGMILDHICEKDLVCKGDASAGVCIAAGYICSNSSCAQQGGCYYEYDWECISGEGACEHSSRWLELSPVCGPKCVNVNFNSCACQCQQMGSGTMAEGLYWLCFTRDGVPAQ
jgi:hypothetical protein